MYPNFACASLKKHHHCIDCVPFIYTYIHFVGVFLPRDLRKWIRGWTYHWILWGRRWAWINLTSLELRGPTGNDAGFKWTNTRTSTSTTKIKPSQPTSLLAVLFHFVVASCYSCKRFSSRVASYIFSRFLQTLNNLNYYGLNSDFFSNLMLFFPTTIYMLQKISNLKRDEFEKFVVCSKCAKLYHLDECLERKHGTVLPRRCCSNILFPLGKPNTVEISWWIKSFSRMVSLNFIHWKFTVGRAS